jgi:methylenetetrahydrofolate dehydrogenase (NADP+) / methenyltetrahydrofolate cyclohydrolase
MDGLRVAADIKSRMREQVSDLKKKGTEPCLATILVGDNLASATYVNNKQKAAADIGIKTSDHRFPSNCSQSDLLRLVNELNNDNKVHGILVQLPLPIHIDSSAITNAVGPLKDVDGLTTLNMGLLMCGRAIFKPCTPAGIIELVDHYKIDLSGSHVVIVNRSTLVGKPLVFLLLEKDATVTICHSKSNNVAENLMSADTIITGVGNRQKFTLKNNMVKRDAVVIDVGISRHEGKLVGDADFDSIKERALWVTPVPGGVGPMTVCMLLKNTLIALFEQKRIVT